MGEPPKNAQEAEKPEKLASRRPAEYYGRPLATVVTEILKKRKAAKQGAATLNEIYQELVVGGCELGQRPFLIVRCRSIKRHLQNKYVTFCVSRQSENQTGEKNLTHKKAK